MQFTDDLLLLRIFLDERQRFKHRALYKAIVLEARRQNLAGATVLRGILGFGADSHIHSTKLLSIADNLPVVIEIIDSPENLKRLYPFLEENLQEGIVTEEKVRAFRPQT